MSKTIVKAARAAYLAKIKVPISTQFVMGRCIPSTKQNAAKIQVTKLQMDPRLHIVRKFPRVYSKHACFAKFI